MISYNIAFCLSKALLNCLTVFGADLEFLLIDYSKLFFHLSYHTALDVVLHLNINSCLFLLVFLLIKGDVKFAEVLEKMGAKVTWTENSVTVIGPPRNSSGRKHLRATDVNMNKMPDVAMTLAVVALYADGPTAIRDGMILLFVSLQMNVF